MIRTAIARVCAAAMIGVAGWRAYECIGPLRVLLSARDGRAFERTLDSAVGDIRVEGDSVAAETAGRRLSRSPSIVFVYHTGCSVCSRTMASWAHLARQARGAQPDAGVYALSIESLDKQRDYWAPLSAADVRLLQLADTANLASKLGTTTVPATLVVRNGRIISVTRGIVGPRTQARILRLLAGVG